MTHRPTERGGRTPPLETVVPGLRDNASLAYLAAIVDSSDDAIISKSLQGIVQTWNTAAERMFGYTADEIVGKSITLLIPPDRLNEEPQILDRLARGERVDHFETVRVRKDGTFLDISLTISPIRNAAGVVIGASKIARDITLRKRVEAEGEQVLARERAARAEAERVSTVKDEFLATLSHELRTPLNAILGWTHILKRSRDLPPDSLTGIDVIERNARVQTRLIDDLLDMSRIISGKLRLDVQRVDLQDVVHAAVASVRHTADVKGVRLTVVLDPLAGPVKGDPARLQQCFWNVLSNAIKFTPRDGKVQVSLERVNSHIEFSVADTGIGIKPEFLPHIFERFRQADASTTRSHGGLGLGLSIVKQLIEMHGGKVRAKSPGVDQGTTISIELPTIVLHRDNAPGEHAHPRGSPLSPIDIDLPSLNGITVLVVDDEPDARELVKRVLEDCGAQVFTADSADAGFRAVRERRPDVIMSDIGMPGRDGYEFIKAVRALPSEEGGRTPAAALTAFARAEDRARALRAGYQSHVAKPVEPVELAAVVGSLAPPR